MKILLSLISSTALLAIASSASAERPAWAFTPPPSKFVEAFADDGQPITIPGSTLKVKRADFHDLNKFYVPDWLPDLHPPMPRVVSHGNPDTKVYACSMCHLATGTGHPESSDLTGLTAKYMIEQLRDFKSGARKGSPMMELVARNMSEDEMKISAEYFASIKPMATYRVKEATTVPKTVNTQPGGMLIADPKGGEEPLGQRIVEIPEDAWLAIEHDTRIQFVAYVPKDAISKGKELVMTGGGRTMPCTSCHGADLKGVGDIPPLAGRSPTHQVRQLYFYQSDMRNGANAPMMKTVVENLSIEDMINVSAYTGSLKK